MPVNWPPASAPSWPPPELKTDWCSCSCIRALIHQLINHRGFTHETPTIAERNLYFQNARCDHGDTVIGRILVSPSGTRYPVAICTDSTHADVLVLWPPYYCGAGSGKNWTW